MQTYQKSLRFLSKNPLVLLPLSIAAVLPSFITVLTMASKSVNLDFLGHIRLLVPSILSIDNHAELVPLLVNLMLSSFPSDQNILILPFSILIFLPAYIWLCDLLTASPPTAPVGKKNPLRALADSGPQFLIFGVSYLILWVLTYILTGLVALPAVFFLYLFPVPLSVILGYIFFIALFGVVAIVWAKSAFWLPLMIANKESITNAIKKSFRQSKGKEIGLIGIFTLNSLIFSFLSVMFGMIPKAGIILSALFSSFGLTALTCFIFFTFKTIPETT